MMKTRSFGRLAIGATLGVVLTIGATQAWQVTAAPGATDATFVAVSPCRLFDMRPAAAPATGKKTPLAAGAANIHTQQVTGNVGSCVGIPSGTVAVAMNVTIVDPTASSFLTVFPADQPQPNASSLNWTAGQAPTPNKVDVKLSADGKIKLFTESGTVNVIADVVGYYTRSSLVELNQRIAALEAQGPVVAYSESATVVPLSLGAINGNQLDAAELLTVTINAPAAGKVAVVAHATARGGSDGSRMPCQITNNPAATTIDVDKVLGIASPSGGALESQPTLGTNRVFDVAAGPNTFDLMCTATGNENEIHYRSMTATFIAN